MPNTSRPSVRNAPTRGAPDALPGRAPEGDADGVDPRVARTTRALGRALVTLIEERAFDAITVQDILDRAGVGRTAFYAHYRNKHDVLYSSYEGLFAWLEPLVERPSAYGAAGADALPRLFPVAEFLAHVGDAEGVVQALRRDGLLDDLWALLAGYAARLIERRLERWMESPGASWPADAGCGPVAAALPRPLLARMLAGALVESIRWWQDHRATATPAAMDVAFHEFARGVLRRAHA